MIDFTVAIRVYNGAHRLEAILEGLRSQVDTDSIQWEVVIVDNNSSDNTAQVVQDHQATWPISAPLIYVFEPQQGAFYARRRAMQAARGALVGFLDDDNVPAPDWVITAYQFGQDHPQAGAYGSRINGVYEVSPPQNFSHLAGFLPVIERKGTMCFTAKNFAHKGLLPPGAGLVIRKQAWVNNVPDEIRLKGPIGQSLSAKGEDIEALSYIKHAGWEIWYHSAMQIYHHIPQFRLEREYLLRFFRGVGLSRCHTRMLVWQPWQRPFVFPVYMINDLKKIVVHYVQHRHEFSSNTVFACQMELFQTSLLSHFYYLKSYLNLK